MNTAQPIRNKLELEKLKNYYVTASPNSRNYLLITIGLNTALRISDILSLRWRDVYDDSKKKFRSHIYLTEQKTDKPSKIFINKPLLQALVSYRRSLPVPRRSASEFLFYSNGTQPLSRVQAYRIIRDAAAACGISGTVSPHSLRKTFGYFAWKSGVAPVLLMNIYNHSSFSVTKRYLGIEQDDRDNVFRKIQL